jgi:putative DNA methylase
MSNVLIESDAFPFESISQIAEKESWRKEVNRPMYHLHKWWAKRLGSVFRAILLGCVLPEDADFMNEFYRSHSYPEKKVLEPFLGSGTTVGEANKLGMTSIGCDINPVAVESVRVALSPLNQEKLQSEFNKLKATIGKYILDNYRSLDSKGDEADILYFFWVMQSTCEKCKEDVDLFSSFILAQDAYPKKKPTIQVICKCCGHIFTDNYKNTNTCCPKCETTFNFREGNVFRNTFICNYCKEKNVIAKSKRPGKPSYRLYAKLLFTKEKRKEYLKATIEDIENYDSCRSKLERLISNEEILLPNLKLEPGHNTQQAINYGFSNWRDFFNERQLLLLGQLFTCISKIEDSDARSVLTMIFSSTLEFNNLFASYKGEGTGAVRHMFAHHVLKPERTPIEANLWGTTKSSGSFSGIFKSKINKIITYRNNPKEVQLSGTHRAEHPLPDINIKKWSDGEILNDGGIYLTCSDSANINLEDKSIDLEITDPPFYDNVQYSELADFFFSWLKLKPMGFIENAVETTRNIKEVQDTDPVKFSIKLEAIFKECYRVLKDDGLLIFTYHHSKNEGWSAIANSILKAGFYVVNYHPIKSEMSVAVPKSAAKEPIQIDIILVCKKRLGKSINTVISDDDLIKKAQEKMQRLESKGFKLSFNDKMIILYGQLLKYLDEWNDERDFDTLLNKYMQRKSIVEPGRLAFSY